MTYSILAISASERKMGVATVSGSVAVGSRVPWVKRGVGLVATQAYTNPALGPAILRLLELGAPPHQALRTALLLDPRPELRQVAVMRVDGAYAVHHGEHIPPWRGHVYDPQSKVLCVANLVRGPEVCREAVSAFKSSKGPLELKLLAALKAAHEAGGDVRGDHSAVMLITGTDPAPFPESELKILDVRVDFSTDPVAHLADLVKRLTGLRLG